MLKNLYETPGVKKHVTTKNSPTLEATGINYRDRVLIVGGSGSGKTHALVSFIAASPCTFHKIIVISKNIVEPLYEFLKDELKDKIVFYDLPHMPPMNQLAALHKEDEKDELLVVYDDLIAEVNDSKKVLEMFIAGRKLCFSQFFLSQVFFKLSKDIRNQLTHVMLLKLSSSNDLNIVIRDFTLGISKETLKRFYMESTKQRLNFLLVDLLSTDPSKKFSHNFANYFHVNEEGDEEKDESDEEEKVFAGGFIFRQFRKQRRIK